MSHRRPEREQPGSGPIHLLTGSLFGISGLALARTGRAALAGSRTPVKEGSAELDGVAKPIANRQHNGQQFFMVDEAAIELAQGFG